MFTSLAVVCCISSLVDQASARYIATHYITEHMIDLPASRFYKQLDTTQARFIMYIITRHDTPDEYGSRAMTTLNLVAPRLKLDMIPFATDMLAHRSEDIRAQAMFAIYRYGKGDGMKLFYHVLHTDGPHASLMAIGHIAERGDRTDIEPLRLWLQSARCREHGPDYCYRAQRTYDRFLARLNAK